MDFPQEAFILSEIKFSGQAKNCKLESYANQAFPELQIEKYYTLH